MKRLLITLILCLIAIPFIYAADEEIPQAVYMVLDDINAYRSVPLDLEDIGLNWTYDLKFYANLAENCKNTTVTSIPQGMMAYDIRFVKMNESYHYRVPAINEFVIRCDELPATSNVPAYVTDAFQDLNLRLHTAYSPQDVKWTWTQQLFTYEELACKVADAIDFPQIEGYKVTITISDKDYPYYMSDDRLIISYCKSPEYALGLTLGYGDGVDPDQIFVGDVVPIVATIGNYGDKDMTEAILLNLKVPHGLYPRHVNVEGKDIDIVPLVEAVLDETPIEGFDDDTTRTASAGRLFLVATEEDDISISYTFRLDPLPAHATSTYTLVLDIDAQIAGNYTIWGSVSILDEVEDTSS